MYVHRRTESRSLSIKNKFILEGEGIAVAATSIEQDKCLFGLFIFIYLFIYLSVYLFVYLFIYLFVCLFVSVSLMSYLSILFYLSVICLLFILCNSSSR